MKKEDVLRMAQEAGFFMNGRVHANSTVAKLSAFAERVAAAEREACAKVAETAAVEFFATVAGQQQALNNRKQIAAAIRARG